MAWAVSPGRLTSIRSGTGLLKDWVCWVPSWIWRVISPSGTESCYTNSSYAPWWTMRAPRGGSLPSSRSEGYRCYNPSVFASLWCPLVCNRQIHEDLGVPLFADHIRALTESLDSKLADVGNPLALQLGRHLRWTRVDPVLWRETQGLQWPAGQSRPSPAMAKSTKRIAFGADQPIALRLTWLRFIRDFSTVVRQMPGYKMQSRCSARTPLPQARRLH